MMKTDLSCVTVQALKDGFVCEQGSGTYRCNFCDASFEQGVIYPAGAQLMDAHKAVRSHVAAEHGPVFSMLLRGDKRSTGLTDTQKQMLASFYTGLSDREIAQASGAAASTVRHQRFSFREKVKQAKLILALSELLEEKPGERGDTFAQIHEGATMVDERYSVTGVQAEKIIQSFFLSTNPPRLKSFSSKEKNKLVILRVIAREFNTQRRYTEKEVNEILKPIHHDYVTLRRYLIGYGFMDRATDGSAYWLK